MWAAPDQLLLNWRGSSIAHEIYFAQLNNLPAFLEEAQEVDRREIIKETLYQFGNNCGKTRGTKEVNLRESKTWRSVLISTGETKVTDSTPAGGLSARVLEIQKKIHQKIENEVEFIRLDRHLARHNGHCAAAIVRHIIENKAAIVAEYERQLEFCQAGLRGSGIMVTNIQKRTLKAWAAIMVGAQINAQLFSFPVDFTAIWNEIKKAIAEMANADPAATIYAILTEIWAANSCRFHTRHPGGEVTISSESETWGVHDTKEHDVYFFVATLRRELEKRGFSWSWINYLPVEQLKQDRGRNTVRSPLIDGKRLRSVCVHMSPPE
jgi:hypothetical protein